jgi:hypothetical protein
LFENGRKQYEGSLKRDPKHARAAYATFFCRLTFAHLVR